MLQHSITQAQIRVTVYAMRGILGPTAGRVILAKQEPTRTCRVSTEWSCAVSRSIFQTACKVLLCTENSAATCETGNGTCIECDVGDYTDNPGMYRQLCV